MLETPSMRSSSLLRRRGFALMVSISFCLCIMLVVGATLSLIKANMGSGTHAELALQARYSAAAGVREVLQRLAADPNWTPPGGSGSVYTPARGTPETLSYVDPRIGFEVRVINNYSGSSAMPRPGGGTIPPGQVWLSAEGTYDGRKLGGTFGLGQKLAVKPDVKIDYALFETISGCQPKNTVIRSYSSEPFVAENADPVSGIDCHNDANMRASASLSFMPPVSIDGSLTIPEPASLTSAAPAMTGSIIYDPVRPLRLKFRVPLSLRGLTATTPVVTPGVPLPPGRYSALTVTAANPATFKSGIYVFDSITVEPGGSIETLLDLAPPPVPPPSVPPVVPELSPVVVYVREIIAVGAGSHINTVSATSAVPAPAVSLPRPRHFQLYTTDEGNDTLHGFGAKNTNVEIESGTEWVGIICGDHAVVSQAGGSTVRGGITVGRHIWGNGATIVYDRTLDKQVLDGDSEWVLIGEGHE